MTGRYAASQLLGRKTAPGCIVDRCVPGTAMRSRGGNGRSRRGAAVRGAQAERELSTRLRHSRPSALHRLAAGLERRIRKSIPLCGGADGARGAVRAAQQAHYAHYDKLAYAGLGRREPEGAGSLEKSRRHCSRRTAPPKSTPLASGRTLRHPPPRGADRPPAPSAKAAIVPAFTAGPSIVRETPERFGYRAGR